MAKWQRMNNVQPGQGLLNISETLGEADIKKKDYCCELKYSTDKPCYKRCKRRGEGISCVPEVYSYQQARH